MAITHREAEIARERRNINPHAEAIMATCLWGDEYSRQRLGCMDWWDTLDDRRKRRVREILNRLDGLKREPQQQ